MFTKILLPLDGSAVAEQALSWVRYYARPRKAQVVLLRVLPTEYPLKGLPFRAGAEDAKRYLQGIERELNFFGVPARIALRSDSVPRTIIDTARRERCDLIVMTSRGASQVVRWLIGGVTQQVMRLSPVPVLIVRSPVASAPHPRPRRILCPQDGSTHARKILPWVGRLARFHRIPAVLLHVASDRAPTARTARISRDSASLRGRGIRSRLCLRQGDPAEEILGACQPGDLLAITTHGHGGIKRLLLGSIAEKLVQLATVPVLIHKTATHERARDLEAVELYGR